MLSQTFTTESLSQTMSDYVKAWFIVNYCLFMWAASHAADRGLSDTQIKGFEQVAVQRLKRYICIHSVSTYSFCCKT